MLQNKSREVTKALTPFEVAKIWISFGSPRPAHSTSSIDCGDRPIARAVSDLPHPPASTMRIGQNLAMAVSIASIAAILFIATASRLAIESRSALPATIRSAARHDHDFSLGSMPGPSVSSDLRADATSKILALAAIIANVGGLAIESRSALPATIHFAARHYCDPSLNSMPGPSVLSDLRADASGKILVFAAIIAATDHHLPDLSNHRDAAIVHLTSPCLCHGVYPAHDSPDYLAPFLADADGNLSSIATIVAATDHHLPDPLQYRDAATSYPFLTRSISIPDRRVTQYWRATELLADAHDSSSFAATNGYIVAERTTARPSECDITRIFSSRHSTSITISRALPSTADADGAANADSATAALSAASLTTPTMPLPGVQLHGCQKFF